MSVDVPVVDGSTWRRYLTAQQVAVVRMYLTPDTATAMLFQNRRNRSLRPAKMREYARAMADGRWESDHPDTIAFAKNGDLINGQHRLTAQVESETALIVNVAFGCSESARLTVDGHMGKSLGDRMWIAGVNVGETATDARRTAEIAVRVWNGPLARKDVPPPDLMAQFIREYHDALRFTVDLFGGKQRGRLTTAPVKAAIARAYYHVSAEKLARFVAVFLTGESAGVLEERNIILARNWILEGKYARNSNSAGEIYRRIARALEAFANGEALKQLKDIGYDPFPLPDRSSTAPRLVSHRVSGDLRVPAAGGQGSFAMAETSGAAV